MINSLSLVSLKNYFINTFERYYLVYRVLDSQVFFFPVFFRILLTFLLALPPTKHLFSSISLFLRMWCCLLHNFKIIILLLLSIYSIMCLDAVEFIFLELVFSEASWIWVFNKFGRFFPKHFFKCVFCLYPIPDIQNILL